MADEIQNPHDKLVHAVLGDMASATSFLQTHLPQELSDTLNWPTLKRLEASFIDETMHDSEADLLYEVQHV